MQTRCYFIRLYIKSKAPLKMLPISANTDSYKNKFYSVSIPKNGTF